MLERDPAAAGDRVAKLQVLAREALEELRSLVFELRPPDLEKDGLGGTLRKHVEVLGRLGQEEIELVLAGELPPDAVRDREILRIAQEALQNVLKHAKAQRVVVTLGGRRRHAAAGGRGRRDRLRPAMRPGRGRAGSG